VCGSKEACEYVVKEIIATGEGGGGGERRGGKRGEGGSLGLTPLSLSFLFSDT
jgi:hypothetical protein